MANFIDYIRWRGDLSFKKVPFNEVDNLIFSQLVYMKFDKIITSEKYTEYFTVADVAAKLLNSTTEDDKISENVTSDTPNDRLFLKELIGSKRFGKTKISRYINKVDIAKAEQFAAATFFTDDGCAFVCYRGTDTSIVGWQENFNLSFMAHVPAQLAAVKYLQEIAGAFPFPLRVGGHSKGGNLAVYAAAFCGKEIQDEILDVYNDDGPGFNKKVVSEGSYSDIIGKVHTFVPQSSIVGMLLEHEEPYIVIHSSENGIMQHNPYSWDVMGPEFVKLNGTDEGSKIIDKTLHEWIGSMNDDQLKAFVDNLFGLLNSSGVHTTEEFDAKKLPAIKKVIQTMSHMDEQDKKMMSKTIQVLFKIGSANFFGRKETPKLITKKA